MDVYMPSAEIYILEPALSACTQQWLENEMPINVKCIKCNKEGNLLKRKSKTRDTNYQYYYVKHTKPKVKWCYFGKYEKLPTIYQDLLQATNQRIQQKDTTGYNIINTVENLNSTFISPNDDKARRADRLVWLGYHPYEVMVAGSSPARPTQPF
jgi:hypothetical protein